MSNIDKEKHSACPQWTTSSRLLRIGESITFTFHLPTDTSGGSLSVFPRYLEQAKPGKAFRAGGALDWLDALPSETISLPPPACTFSISYSPKNLGNYLARWRLGQETFYRYFSVIEDDSIVLRFSTFGPLESEPSLHSTGIPLDYRLSAAQFDPVDPLFQRLYSHHRKFGDSLIPFLPDMPSSYTVSDEERAALYRNLLEKARSAMPFPDDIRSARVEMNHPVDPGYTRILGELGVRDHCGLQEANAKPWLGMPEFPYFSSPADCRKTNQAEGGDVVAHQWDFCGGFHFLGPVSWHYKVGEGDWSLSEKCLRDGMEELKNLAAINGHPAFAYPLYDGVLPPGYPDDGILDSGFPNPKFTYDLGDEKSPQSMHSFVEHYQRFIAFELPKTYKLVYARSIDIADYYTRHFTFTPRTVFVSKTDHVEYDKWWLCHWGNDNLLVPRAELAWTTRISDIHAKRRETRYFKDPLSFEYIQVEDQGRSMRFEYACPNPVWWFDYREEKTGPQGSSITHTETPDVEIKRSKWTQTDQNWTQTLKISTEATFPNYAITLWDLPAAFSGNPSQVRTNAKECIVAWNRSYEYRLILVFDLVPNLELEVVLGK